MGEDVEHVTVVGFTPSALLSTNAAKLATILSWLCTVDDAVLKVHFQPVPRITVVSDATVPNAAQLKKLLQLGNDMVVKELQVCHVLTPLIVKLVRLTGRVKEINEMKIYQLFSPLIVKLVCHDFI